MEFINFKENKEIRRDIEPLYISAFPEEERPPAFIFFDKCLEKGNELYGVYENNEFIGFTNVLSYKDISYIFFLAVSLDKRNQGYGSKILQSVLNLNKEMTYFLCYEEIDEKYPDNSLRIKRREFYYRNGFKDNKLKTREYGVYYDTCYQGKHLVSFDDYLELMIARYGNRAKKYIKKAS